MNAVGTRVEMVELVSTYSTVTSVGARLRGWYVSRDHTEPQEFLNVLEFEYFI